MSKTSISMMSSTQNQWEVTGDPIRADGWYGMTDGLHTISAVLVDFKGDLVIEASLVADPQDGDWFMVDCGCSKKLSFPSDGSGVGATKTIGFNVVGSFVWLRARIDRSAIQPKPAEDAINDYGFVDRILINI